MADDDRPPHDLTNTSDQQKPSSRTQRSASTNSRTSIPPSVQNEKESNEEMSEEEDELDNERPMDTADSQEEKDSNHLDNRDENGIQEQNEIHYDFTVKSNMGLPSLSENFAEQTVKGCNIPVRKAPKVPEKGHSMLKRIGVYGAIIVSLFAIFSALISSKSSKTSVIPVKQSNWRDYVDKDRVLPPTIRSNILASLKPVSASALQEKTVATLLILSKDEEIAADIGRCLLKIVNSRSGRNEISSEIDFQNDTMSKLEIDNHLQALLKPDETMLGALIRNIDNLSSKHALDRARLLFSYCDGENPKIPNRFIIMTATAGENIRQRFAAAWPDQSDLIDPLMARISGNTIVIDPGQKSICEL